jgi:hypothetical protein
VVVIPQDESTKQKRTPAELPPGRERREKKKGVQLSGAAAAPDQLFADIFYITTRFCVYL